MQQSIELNHCPLKTVTCRHFIQEHSQREKTHRLSCDKTGIFIRTPDRLSKMCSVKSHRKGIFLFLNFHPSKMFFFFLRNEPVISLVSVVLEDIPMSSDLPRLKSHSLRASSELLSILRLSSID